MSLDFTIGDAVMFAAIGKAAVYTPPAGAPVAVTAVLDLADVSAGFSPGGVSTPQRVVRVRVAELAAPVRDATLAVAGETLTLGTPERDEAGAVWVIPARA